MRRLGFLLLMVASAAPAAYAEGATCAQIWHLFHAPASNLQRHRQLVGGLSKFAPELKSLYAGKTKTSQGYTVSEHTVLVLEVLAEQMEPYRLHFGFGQASQWRLPQLLQACLALHDIGKPLAIAAGSKRRQHHYTGPILEAKLRDLGFTESEIALGKSLILNDIMGDLVKGRIDHATAAERLRPLAAAAGLELSDFLPLQALVYTADAASYPNLRPQLFGYRNGLLLPHSPAFAQLMTLAP